MKKTLLFFCLLFTFTCCKTIDSHKEVVHQCDDCLTVLNILKKKNNVFIIYAERRDTVFKICSHYDEELPHKKCKKIKKGDKFHSVLLSQFREIETKWGIMPNLGVGIVYFGVYVTRRDNKWDDKYFKGKIGDVHISYDLNGLYPKSCYHN